MPINVQAASLRVRGSEADSLAARIPAKTPSRRWTFTNACDDATHATLAFLLFYKREVKGRRKKQWPSLRRQRRTGGYPLTCFGRNRNED
jgi:hypothetical protein